MSEAANKTVETDALVEYFLASVEPASKQADARALVDLFTRISGETPQMWGPSIIGFGRYHYKYDSGREGDFLRTGFSPRKANLSIYLMGGYYDAETGVKQADQLARLGKWKRGKSCLYINRLDQVDLKVLEEMIRDSWDAMAQLYPE